MSTLTPNFTKHSLKDVSGYNKQLHHAKWNSDGSYLSVVCGDKSVRISQLEDSVNLSQIHTIPTSVVASKTCWHPTELGRLAICSDDKLVELWDVRGNTALFAHAGPSIL